MGLFRKKKTVTNTCCTSNFYDKTIQKTEQSKSSGSGIKILGSGCKKCNELEAATKEALSSLGMEDSIEHVTDFTQIASYGVMTTPALVIDGKVMSYGKVLKKNEVEALIKKARG